MEASPLTWICNFIWSITNGVFCDLHVCGKFHDVILLMTVIRRLDADKELTKSGVLDMRPSFDKADMVHQDAALRQAAGLG